MNETLQTLKSFNEELRKIAELALDNHPQPENLQQAQAVLAFGKGYKTHGAILILCEKGYGEDAAILSRSLLELSLSTVYIMEDTTGLAAKRYFEYDYILREKMYKYLVTKDDLKKELEEKIESFEGHNATIKEVQEKAAEVKLGYSKKELGRNNWSGKTVKEIASAVGREDLFHTVYSLQCSLSHSDASVANNYYKEEEEVSFIEIGSSENWISTTLVVSIDCFLGIIKTWNSTFKHGLDSKLEDFEDRYVKNVEILNKEKRML